MDKNNPVIKLVKQGMRMEKVGDLTRAQELYIQAWNEATNDWEKCIAAHFIPRNLTDLQEKLKWNLDALDLANKVHNNEVKGYYPSLYLNIGLCYENLLNYQEAKKFYIMASEKIPDLPTNKENEKYTAGIKETIIENMTRLEEKMIENIESKKEIPIKEIGSFFEKDKDGFLINPASPEKIQKEWKPVVKDVVETYKTHYGENLHSVYIRGSVGKGDAILGMSDVDTFAYVTIPKEEIKTDWMNDYEKELSTKYPFIQGIELSVDPVEDAYNDKILILQSACVYGTDLNNEIPKVKVGKDTLSHIYSFAKNLKWFDEWILQHQEKEEIKKSCIWLMKRFLRTGIELTMEQAGQYTKDLYPSYKIFAEYYPEKDKEMKEALYLALNPTDDLDMIKKVRNNLGVWLEEQTKDYKKP